MITKKALNLKKYRRNWKITDAARTAWSDIIEIYKVQNPNGQILLPAYIGWSKNEGSGIFDSVHKSKCQFDFYGLNNNLQIDFEELKQKLTKDRNQLVLLVHYFGFTDNLYNQITKWLKKNNIFYVEDCAHAWLTDLIGAKCGRKGAYSFYSIHKLLPNLDGGMFVENKLMDTNNDSLSSINPSVNLSYDLTSIYKIRRSNYKYLNNLLKDVHGVEIIYKKLKKGICPQTFPVKILNYDRTTLYNEMNEKGFGVVSLYHTMISQLDNSEYESVKIVSKKILNLPIHQDVSKKDIDEMVLTLKAILNV